MFASTSWSQINFPGFKLIHYFIKEQTFERTCVWFPLSLCVVFLCVVLLSPDLLCGAHSLFLHTPCICIVLHHCWRLSARECGCLEKEAFLSHFTYNMSDYFALVFKLHPSATTSTTSKHTTLLAPDISHLRNVNIFLTRHGIQLNIIFNTAIRVIQLKRK